MINEFTLLLCGHVRSSGPGQIPPANERRYSTSIWARLRREDRWRIATKMDSLAGHKTIWLAEHHFQHEG